MTPERQAQWEQLRMLLTVAKMIVVDMHDKSCKATVFTGPEAEELRRIHAVIQGIESAQGMLP